MINIIDPLIEPIIAPIGFFLENKHPFRIMSNYVAGREQHNPPWGVNTDLKDALTSLKYWGQKPYHRQKEFRFDALFKEKEIKIKFHRDILEIEKIVNQNFSEKCKVWVDYYNPFLHSNWIWANNNSKVYYDLEEEDKKMTISASFFHKY